MSKCGVVHLSDEESYLVAVFGVNRMRAEVVKALTLSEGEVATSVLMKRLGGGLQLTTLLRHLEALEAAGAVTSSAQPGARQGRMVLWKLERDRLRTGVQALWDSI